MLNQGLLFRYDDDIQDYNSKEGMSKITAKYSVCITCFNEVRTVQESIASIISQIDDDFEVIVVDNESTDGTFEILGELSNTYPLKIIRRKCTRGKGRQIAFENSTGEYILANLDMDDVYGPRLSELLSFYHAQCEGRVLLVTLGLEDEIRGLQNITIVPRSLATSLGGWRDLQWGEDWEFWCRARKIDKFSWTIFKLGESFNQHSDRKKSSKKIGLRYVKYRDFMRVGRSVFEGQERVSASQRLTYLLAKFTSFFYPSYGDSFTASFSPFEMSNFIAFKANNNRMDSPIDQTDLSAR